MVKCRECLLHSISSHIRRQNGLLEEHDVCTLNARARVPVDLDKDRKCPNFVPFPDRDARRMFE